MVSHRFGGFDGVSVEAHKWLTGFELLGCNVVRAGGHFDGPPRPNDVVVEGLWAPVFGGTPPPVDRDLVDSLCSQSDLIVLDNLGSLWTTPAAAAVWEAAILRAGVPTVVRHHDPPWQTMHDSTPGEHVLPLRHPAMLHVTINRRTRDDFLCRWPELGSNGSLEVAYNTVDFDAVRGGDRFATRRRRGVLDNDLLVVHPARNIERKNAGRARDLVAALDSPHRRAHYWLTDPVGEIDATAPSRSVSTLRGWESDSASMYAAADLVVLPSSWEGWGLPVVEAAASGTLVAAGPYPVLDEIRNLGFVVLDGNDSEGIRAVLSNEPAKRRIIDSNMLAAQSLKFEDLPQRLRQLSEKASAVAVGHPEIREAKRCR